MAFKNPPDTIKAQLSYEGRNLLSRCKLGDVVYRALGWQLGFDGYQDADPTKIKADLLGTLDQFDGAYSPLDLPSGWEGGAVGYIEVSTNTFVAGDYICLNGKYYYYDDGAIHTDGNSYWSAGSDKASTVQNIIEKITDTNSPEHGKIIFLDTDPADTTGSTIRVTSFIMGEIGNSYQISASSPFSIIPMSSGSSAALIDPAYPTPTTDPLNPAVAPFIAPDGDKEAIRIQVVQPGNNNTEYSSTLSGVSFLARIPDGITGYNDSPSVNAYGELAIWVEILNSNFTEEIGRKALFALAHYPISCKSDRQILVKRIVIGF